MKVKTDSWHYKLAEQWDGFPSDSLCKYFWEVVFGALILLTAALLLSSILILTLFVLLYPVLRPWTPFLENVWPLSMTAWLIAGSVAITILRNSPPYRYSKHWLFTRLWTKSVPDPEPNIFVEYLSAKKAKICPKIEFE